EGAILMWAHRKTEILKLEAEMESYKQTIIKAAKFELEGNEACTVGFIAGDFSVKVGFGWDIKIPDVEALKKALGKRFTDLVKVESVYKPEAKLKEMALSDKDIEKCLVLKEKAPSVSLEKKV
ncbi:MAG: hypothetical protein RL154_1553, partial [Pseudomonadota bacterium]